jgi:archaellum biogenesis ATPase FlaH
MSAYQILVQFFHSKGYNQNIHVVSPVVGETSAVKHIQHNYPFFDQFEKIIVCFDNDEAGIKGAADVAEVLPAGKTYVMSFMEKDVNDCLVHNNPKEFIDAYYAAKKYMPEGIKSSDTCMEAVINELNTPRLTLPSYMNQMQANMGGGILDATITNVIADTSVGKSSHVNNMVYHWVFNAPTPPTIISLEATQGQWTVDLLSLHLKTNLRWMEEKERTEFLSDPLTVEKCNQFFYKEDGSSRFYIIDDREGDIKKLEKLMERAYKQFGSNIIIFDVLTDALRGMDSDLQESHMKFQKMFIKNGIRLINVLHTRKPPKSKDGKPVPISEYDALGSSTFVQSGAYNILLERDKEAEDVVEKNTTYVRMPKCRGGITGACGEWYFDFKTRQCYDKKDYFTSKDQVVTTEDGFEVTI